MLFRSHKLRPILYWPTGIFIALVGISRLYLGAHWFTDVIGSYCLGTAILLLVIACFRRHAWQLETERHWFITTFLVALIIPWLAYTAYDIRKLHHERTPVWPTFEVPIQKWWHAPTPFAPTYRLNRFGTPIQPFNIQWAGNVDEIEQRLRDSGWQILGDRLTLRNEIGRAHV